MTIKKIKANKVIVINKEDILKVVTEYGDFIYIQIKDKKIICNTNLNG